MASDVAAGTRHVVARSEDLPPGRRKLVRIGSREIGIFNVGGRLYGIRNICPHRTGPLCLGRLRPLVRWEDADMVYDREDEILKCPWHQYEFDLETGTCIVDPDLRVRTYRVEIENDDIVLYT